MSYRTEAEREAAKKDSRKRYYLKVQKEKKENGWIDKRTLRPKGLEKSYEYWIIARCKNRAIKRGLEFNLVEDDVVVPDFCPVLGIPLKPASGGFANDNSPSVDRIDSSKGYTKDNIRVISWRANKLKCDANIEEIRAILKYMEESP